MPVTKREAHYGSPKELINYILDEKHDGEKVGQVSSINCNPETALLEFRDIQRKYNMKGSRVAYHIIQSFSPKDDITEEQANEIGKRLCEELYPDYQCIISTHVDKGHIHNHICLNAISLDGKKLEDRLSNEKEGLYGLSDTSDKIAAEYGCFIMPRKTYMKSKTKDYYHQYKEQSWKEKIKEDIEGVLPKCDSLEEFFDELAIAGYKVRRGKNLSVKCLEMERFARLNTIHPSLSTNSLYTYFKNKDNINLSGINFKENTFNIDMLSKIIESKTAIEKSSIQTEGKKYSEYQKTRYQEIKRFYTLKQQLEYLDKYNIRSFDDIEKQIEFKRSEIKSKNITLKKNKEEYDAILEKTEKAQDYIRFYKVYEYAKSYQEQDPKYVMPKEVEIFLNLQNELQINSLDEARSLVKSTRQERIDINKTKKEILDLQRELNHLDTIKEEKLIQSGLFIHNIKFGGNHIDYKKSKDDMYCIILPYTKERMYIPKKYTAFNEKYQYYTLFLVDDKEYELYDENRNDWFKGYFYKEKKLRAIPISERKRYYKEYNEENILVRICGKDKEGRYQGICY